MNSIDHYKNKGYAIITGIDPSIIQNLHSAVMPFIANPNLCRDTSSFREALLTSQNLINESGLFKKIVKDNFDFFSGILNHEPFHIQSVAYLRGVRPKNPTVMEFLDFHRENFYNDYDYINHQINIHVPIFNYTNLTAMQYIEDSHLIPDEMISVSKKDSLYSGIEKFSLGHKLGITYNPKLIIGGVNLESAVRVNMKVGDCFVFTSKLIHGGGSNLSPVPRFSIDFGLLPASKAQEMKEFHFASYGQSSKSHYIPFN